MPSYSILTIACALVAVLSGLSGCCARNKCGTPPTTIVIRDTSDNRILGVTAAIAGAEVVPCDVDTDCDYSIRGASGTVMITAPGYKSATATLEPRQGDCGNALGERVEITLQPVTSAEESKVLTEASEGCGH